MRNLLRVLAVVLLCAAMLSAQTAVTGVNSSRLLWSLYIPGAWVSTGTSLTGDTLPLEANIIVKRVDVSILSAYAAGCSAAPVFRITDGTTQINVPIANSTANNSLASLNTAYKAGTTLTIYQVAGTGCSTQPNGAKVVVQYVMR